jgi:hypothetical protein
MNGMDEEMLAFLNARLDEDEARAKDDFVCEPIAVKERALREVAGKRKILAEHEAVTRLAKLTEQDLGFLGWYREWVLKNLAAAWSDNPDYREIWAP